MQSIFSGESKENILGGNQWRMKSKYFEATLQFKVVHVEETDNEQDVQDQIKTIMEESDPVEAVIYYMKDCAKIL